MKQGIARFGAETTFARRAWGRHSCLPVEGRLTALDRLPGSMAPHPRTRGKRV